MKIKELILVILSVAQLTSCSDETDQLTAKEKATILLCKTWGTGSVILDGQDITDFGYTNTELTFIDNGTWTAINGGDIFESSGTWSFSNQNFTQLNISGVEATISLNPQGQSLQLNLIIVTGPIGGRNTNINGDYSLFLLPKYSPE
ncbi:MAG: hypothetical protein KF725_12835 [Cyclobacteriaceae bacterium]|nr:hypothetical protein [Cyclobacteriaceae bacterium]UYN85486.1 MAG: hypothetical protein KIT51_11380 [Cyclobacteriaceae bacterium]